LEQPKLVASALDSFLAGLDGFLKLP